MSPPADARPSSPSLFVVPLPEREPERTVDTTASARPRTATAAINTTAATEKKNEDATSGPRLPGIPTEVAAPHAVAAAALSMAGVGGDATDGTRTSPAAAVARSTDKGCRNGGGDAGLRGDLTTEQPVDPLLADFLLATKAGFPGSEERDESSSHRNAELATSLDTYVGTSSDRVSILCSILPQPDHSHGLYPPQP